MKKYKVNITIHDGCEWRQNTIDLVFEWDKSEEELKKYIEDEWISFPDTAYVNRIEEIKDED